MNTTTVNYCCIQKENVETQVAQDTQMVPASIHSGFALTPGMKTVITVFIEILYNIVFF